MTEHVVPKRVYFAVFAALMVLTAVTVKIAFVDLGALNTVVAMAIAGLKAVLVVLFFMHVRWSPRLTSLVVVGGFLWLAILILMSLVDFSSRAW